MANQIQTSSTGESSRRSCLAGMSLVWHFFTFEIDVGGQLCYSGRFIGPKAKVPWNLLIREGVRDWSTSVRELRTLGQMGVVDS